MALASVDDFNRLGLPPALSVADDFNVGAPAQVVGVAVDNFNLLLAVARVDNFNLVTS
jgi:hypothetical protein